MEQSDAFAAIADPNRRYLLEELRRGPKTVGELASGLPVSRPAVSQHLKVLLVDDSIRHLILEHASAEVIMKAARANGMVTMYEDGVLKAFAGHTSIDEVLRVTHQ